MLQQEAEDADAELLFVDEDFPADRSTLTLDAPPDTQWRRPHELCEEPQLFVDGTSRFDVVQGALGNCWSMAACAAMAERPELVRRVVPDGQILHGPGYSGCIVIRLWHMNHWRDVEIDDRLPVEHDELLYGRSSCPNEFWMSLVEKAFAKFHGGYENLNSGHLTEGFINLTGYSVRSMEFTGEEFQNSSKRKNELFKLVSSEIENRSLLACARGGDFERGLPGFHGYTVTGARHERSLRQRLLRVRNPWGDDEWTGKWRDDHDIWKELGPDVLEEMDYKVHQDGESWMKFADFLKMFQEICIGSRQPSIHADKYLPATEEKVIREFWTKETAGGPFGSATFFRNPQILLNAVALRTEATASALESSEDDSEDAPGEKRAEARSGAGPGAGARGHCSEDPRCDAAGVPVLLELLQDHNRRVSIDLLAIDFRVFRVVGEAAVAAVDAGARLSRLQLQEDCALVAHAASEGPCSAAQTFCHLQHCARYVVVPHTADAGEERRFLLRVFARNAHLHLGLLQVQAEAEDQVQEQIQTQTEDEIQTKAQDRSQAQDQIQTQAQTQIKAQNQPQAQDLIQTQTKIHAPHVRRVVSEPPTLT